MSPSLTQNDLTDGIMAKTKFSANISRTFASGMTGSYAQNHLGSDRFGVSAVLKGMPGISFGCAPFKINENIVSSDEIEMIDLREIVWIGDVRDSHQAMDGEVLHPAISVSQQNSPVSILIGFWRQKLGLFGHSFCAAAPIVSNDPAKATDAPEAGNFIQRLKPDDRSPFFIDHPASPKVSELAFVARYRGTSQTKELN